MKRALILIVVITVLTVGGCCWLDHKQQQTAMEYLEGLTAVRRLILQGDMAQALREQACLHALWQHDAHWLNALWDHHHTRDVEASMRHLATALEENSRLHALLAMDDVMDALEAVAQRDMAAWVDGLRPSDTTQRVYRQYDRRRKTGACHWFICG